MPFNVEVEKGKSGHGGIESKAQARAFFAAAHGDSTIGIPQKVGQEMTEGAGHGRFKGALKGLPEHRQKKVKAVSFRHGGHPSVPTIYGGA